MAIESTIPRSRRALLAASLGGLAAFAAQALGRPAPARAEGEYVQVGGEYATATSVTWIANTTNAQPVLLAESSGAGIGVGGSSGSGTGIRGSSGSGKGVIGLSGSSYGVYGESVSSYGVYGYSDPSYGVRGESYSSYGVYGVSGSNIGIYGASTSHVGVHGQSSSKVGVRGLSSSSFGVLGQSTSSCGVYGLSDAADLAATVGQSTGEATGLLGYSGGLGDPLPAAPAKTGVYGYGAQDSDARGVTGQTKAGRGVNGVATSGRGVNGYASSGVGVYAACGANGKALHAEGRVSFKTSGLASIGAGASSAAVDPGVDLTASSRILCTLEGNPGSGVMVQRVVKNTTTDAFTVYLNKATVNAAKVAWFVIG